MMRRVGRLLLFVLVAACAGCPASAETTVDDNGVKWVCEDGLCRIVEGGETAAIEAAAVPESGRSLFGYQDAESFLAFLAGDTPPASRRMFDSLSLLTLVLVFLGGLALNLTPCVLPMIPVNLIVIGKSATRGLIYAAGLALSYGALGVLAAFGALAFGTIQASVWFNVFVAVVFVVLALALFGFWTLDLTRFRPSTARLSGAGTLVAVFLLGGLSAVLAGACVAPVLISVLLLTARLYADGQTAALILPFVLGLGMALPWPFLGAGLKVLPKPGRWMKMINRLFAVVVLGFAVWYARLAWLSWRGSAEEPRGVGVIAHAIPATPATFDAALAQARTTGRPVLVDCWASWCKNCAAMERATLADARVKAALADFAVIRLNAQDIKALRALAPFKDVPGLPAFVILPARETPVLPPRILDSLRRRRP